MLFESDYKVMKRHIHKVIFVQAYPSIEFKTGILYKVTKKFIKLLVIVQDNYLGMQSAPKCELMTIKKQWLTKVNYPDEYEYEIILSEFEEVSNLKNFYNIKPRFYGYSQRKKI